MKKSRLIHEDKLLKSRTRCPTMFSGFQNDLFETHHQTIKIYYLKKKEESNWKKSFPVGFIIFLKHISVTNQFTGMKIVFEGFPYSDL